MQGGSLTVSFLAGGLGARTDERPIFYRELAADFAANATYSRDASARTAQVSCTIQSAVKPANLAGAAKQTWPVAGAPALLFQEDPIWSTATGVCYARVDRYYDWNITGEDANDKMFRGWVNTGSTPDIYHATRNGTDTISIEGAGGDGQFFQMNFAANQWLCDEHEFRASSANGIQDGISTMWRNGAKSLADSVLFTTRTVGDPGIQSKWFLDQMSNAPPPATGRGLYFSSMYVSDTFLRVFLSTESSYSSIIQNGSNDPGIRREVQFLSATGNSGTALNIGLIDKRNHASLEGLYLWTVTSARVPLRIGQIVASPIGSGKIALPKLFLRTPIGGFRYSRGPADIHSPSPPSLYPPVPNITTINIAWINGVDAETGIAATYAEISPSGANTWTRTVLNYPLANNTFTGLTSGLPYDVRVANTDNAGNVSAYCPIQTLTTLSNASDLEPGAISLPAVSLTLSESALFSVTLARSGAGVSSPAVEADWQFSGFSEGTPSPANGTVTFPAGANGAQIFQSTTGAVLADRAGMLRIAAVRALSGTIQPSLGISQASVTILEQNASAPLIFSGTSEPGSTGGTTVVNGVGWTVSTNGAGGLTPVTVIAPQPVRAGLRSIRFEDTFTGVGQSFRSEVRAIINNQVTEQFYWYGYSMYLPSVYWTPTNESAQAAVLGQWHGNVASGGNNPPLSFGLDRTTSGSYDRFILHGCYNLSTDGTQQVNYPKLDLGLFSGYLGRWVDVVAQILWSASSRGVTRFWIDGIQVLNRAGPNCFIADGTLAPYFKMGIYNEAWRRGAPVTSPAHVIAYFDELRVSGSNASYAVVAPPGIPP